jgi:hypothetical protein
MFSRLALILGSVAAVVAGVVLYPAAPAEASGTFFMTGTYEMNNGFALRRRIRAFQSPVVTTDASGMGGVTISPGVFSQMGNPVDGEVVAGLACPDPSDPGALFCMLQFGAVGWQAFPGFPVFAQGASTFTELNVGVFDAAATGTLAPGNGPGTFNFCPLVGNPNNGPGPTPACPGLGLGSPTGVQGLVQYSAGGGFGGTMAIVRNSTVVISQRRNLGPTRFQHDKAIYAGAPWNIGVPMSFTSAVTPSAGPITQSPVLGPFTSIQTIGSQVGTGTGVLPSTSTGFPWTTGMVRVVEDSCVIEGTCPTPFNPNPFRQFTVTGTDARGPDGQGQLSLVSGGMIQNRDGLSAGNWGNLDLVLALPEPGTALGLASGVLLLMGLARRRA